MKTTKYEFGVMSRKWSLKASSKLVAYLAITGFIGKNIPVAVYAPEKEAFMPAHYVTKMKPELDAEVIKAMKSIKEEHPG